MDERHSISAAVVAVAQEFFILFPATRGEVTPLSPNVFSHGRRPLLQEAWWLVRPVLFILVPRHELRLVTALLPERSYLNISGHSCTYKTKRRERERETTQTQLSSTSSSRKPCSVTSVTAGWMPLVKQTQRGVECDGVDPLLPRSAAP